MSELEQPYIEKPYTPQSLAVRWGCSDKLIHRMIRDGELPHFNVGILKRIPAKDVYQWEENQRNSATIGQNIKSEDIHLDNLMDAQQSTGLKAVNKKEGSSTLTQKSRDALHLINSSANGKTN